MEFGEFFLAVKDRLTLEQIRELDPFAEFVKEGNSFLALKAFGKNGLWVDWSVGEGLDWMHKIRDFARRNNIKVVAFETKSDNKAVLAIAKYWKARRIADIAGKIVFEIDVFGVR